MNKLHVYTGNGKGKTTAAMGLAVRSLGHGNTVLIGQFVKDGRSGELIAFKAFEKAIVYPGKPLSGFTFAMTDEEKAACKKEQGDYALELIGLIAEKQPQTVILDELGMALSLNMIDEEIAKRLIDSALEAGETVVTGGRVPDWLVDRADYVSRITAEKHPFATEKLAARKGVEW